MKSSQWVGALVVLGVMVFAITFAMNFLNTGKPPETGPAPPPPNDGPELTFFGTTIPAEPGEPFIYHENKQEGSVDFVFENPNAEDVKIGLVKKNCRCAKVKLVLPTPEWKTRRALVGAAQSVVAAGFPAAFDPAAFNEATTKILQPDQDAELQKLQGDLPVVATMEAEGKPTEATVPAKAVGIIRVGWDDTKVGVERFSAELWVGNPNNAKKPQLSAEVHFVAPLEVASTDLPVKELNETELEKKPYKGSFLVWSAIKPALNLKIEKVELPRYEAGRFDPFKVEPVEKLTAEEVGKLKGTLPGGGTARCAYKIPVKLYGLSPDGKVAVDLGTFRRRLKVWNEGDKEPIELTVTGSVQGNVLIGDALDGGKVSLPTFDSHVGTPPKVIALTGKVPGLQLEVDKERTPEFLRDGARLEKSGDLAGLPRWKLLVGIKPDAAHGPFPRQDDPLYADSAVYLKVKKVKGEVVQNVRVPVDGTANDQ